jgi:nitrite reductase/ring-hydroxylating ferredoxin subunit
LILPAAEKDLPQNHRNVICIFRAEPVEVSGLCGKIKFPKGIKNNSMATNAIWHKIADNISEINFNARGLAEVEINGKIICLAKHNNHLFACAQKCPHAGALLADGHIDAFGDLVCPLHKYKFSLKNGRNVSGEGYYLKIFKVEESDSGVFVSVETTGLF